MELETGIAKTAKGLEEIESKKYKLPARARTLLILVDGVKTLATMREMATKLGLPETQIDELISQGFVEVKSVPLAPTQAVAPVAVPLAKVTAGGGTGNRDPASAGAASVSATGVSEYDKFRVAKQFMNDTVVNSLGIKSFFFTLKLEKCSTREDLRGLLEPYSKAMEKSSGAQEEALLTQRLRELLAA